MQGILGEKIEQTQFFTKDGERIPVSKIFTGSCFVVAIKTEERDGYWALVLGTGYRREKTVKKPILGIYKKAGIKKAPRFLVEIRSDKEKIAEMKMGDELKVENIFKEGEKVAVSGVSKGKGFAGVVKRHHFRGGPHTHGQSDRERAPGSIGQTTTPGRVYKGKRMAGRMGGDRVTVKNLEVVKIEPEKSLLWLKGLVPGGRRGLLTISKV